MGFADDHPFWAMHPDAAALLTMDNLLCVHFRQTARVLREGGDLTRVAGVAEPSSPPPSSPHWSHTPRADRDSAAPGLPVAALRQRDLAVIAKR
jgi:hypothetical protein